MHPSESSTQPNPFWRDHLLEAVTRPLTVVQLAARLGVLADTCSRQLQRMASEGLVECVEPRSRRCRVYARVTALSAEEKHEWALYGWACFSHRSAILTALDGQMQGAAIKRRARYLDPSVRMSANNARDVLYQFLARGIVRRVWLRKKAHPRYELTKLGRRLQTLLLTATTR